MADDRLGVQLVVEGLDAYTRDMRRAQGEADKLAKELTGVTKASNDVTRGVTQAQKGIDSVSASTTRASGGFMGMVRNVRDVAQSFNESVRAVQRVIHAIDQFVSRGVEVGRIRWQFEELAGGAGAAAAELEEMRASTGGTIDDFRLMEAGVSALNFGLVDSVDALDEFTRVARIIELTSTAGANAITEMSLAAANMSIRRFDQLGLSVSRFNKILDELRDTSTGLSKEELWQEAFWQLLTERADQMGGVMDESVGGGIDKARAAWTNFRDTMSEGIAIIVDDIFNKLIPAIEDVAEFLNIGQGDLQAWTEEAIVARDVIEDIARARELGLAIDPDIEKILAAVRAGLIDVTEAVPIITALPQFQDLQASIEATEAEMAELAATTEQLILLPTGQFVRTTARALEELEATENALDASTRRVGSGFADLTDDLEGHALAVEDLTLRGGVLNDLYNTQPDITRRVGSGFADLTDDLEATTLATEDLYQRSSTGAAVAGEGMTEWQRIVRETREELFRGRDPLDEMADAYNRLGMSTVDASTNIAAGLKGARIEADELADAASRAQAGLEGVLGVEPPTELGADLFREFAGVSEELDIRLGLLLGTTNETEVAFDGLAGSLRASLEAGDISEEEYVALVGTLNTLLSTGTVTADTLDRMTEALERGSVALAQWIALGFGEGQPVAAGAAAAVTAAVPGPGGGIAGAIAGIATAIPAGVAETEEAIGGVAEDLDRAVDAAQELRDLVGGPLESVVYSPENLGLTDSSSTATTIADETLVSPAEPPFDPAPLGLEASYETSVDITTELSTPVTKIVTLQFEGDMTIPLPGMQVGGPVRAGMPVMVGEGGVELFIPRTNGMILPNAMTRAVLNDTGAGAAGAMSSRQQNINFNGPILGTATVTSQLRQALAIGRTTR